MDTGYDLLAASRTAQGELPYVDYEYFYGPLGPLLLGGIYAVTGTAVWPAAALGLVLAAAATALTYRLARRFAAAAGRRGRRRARRGCGAVERQQLVRAAALDLGAARDRARTRARSCG